MEREVKQTFLMIAGVITALLLPALVFVPSVEQKVAGFVAIIAVAAGVAALVVRFRRKQ